MKRVKVTPQTKKDKVLRQFNIIRDRTLLNQVDERLEKTPLKYFTEFVQTKILASITANVKEDVLGNFYGEFMKYSGGDGKSLGVVLTPPHITELFCDLVQLKPTDIILDPCCGTAGFLISAMHQMENMAETEEQKKHEYFYWIWAIRVGKWKLHPAGKNRYKLYDLENDIAEKNDLADKMPEVVARCSKYFEIAKRKK